MRTTSLFLLLIAACSINAGSLISDQNLGNLLCVPFAYGDFNADKLVDIFCVAKTVTDKTEYSIQIWLGVEFSSSKTLFTQFKTYYLDDKTLPIVNIVPGDFDGDSNMDMLVVFKNNNVYKMSLFLGNGKVRNQKDLLNGQIIAIDLQDQPFAADFDGDGKTDLLVQEFDDKNIMKYLHFDHKNIREPATQDLPFDKSIELFNGYAHSLTDLNNDFITDFVLVAELNKLTFNPFIMNTTQNQYVKLSSYSAPNLQVYGQSIFADFDSDGTIEHLLPGCEDYDCKKPVIYIYKDSQWNNLNIDFGTYGFIPPNENKDFWASNNISIKVGDYDLNGYLDLLVILKDNNSNSTNRKDKYAVLMKSTSISNDKMTFKRTFIIDSHLIGLFSYSNVIQASFFDFHEDGYLDILLTVQESDGTYKVIAVNNDYYDDVYFLKVMVIPGTCSTDKCPAQTLPYGLNYPGALVKMDTTSYDFKPVILYSCQLSQSSHMSLQLPYIIFGLGSTPNFVEELKVGVLAASAVVSSKLDGFSKEWHQIIPNSQLVINPYPRNFQFNWKMQLFITPSKNILMTAISLGSTMICLIIIIGILQFRERKIDEKERKLESQRFHFDGL